MNNALKATKLVDYSKSLPSRITAGQDAVARAAFNLASLLLWREIGQQTKDSEISTARAALTSARQNVDDLHVVGSIIPALIEEARGSAQDERAQQAASYRKAATKEFRAALSAFKELSFIGLSKAEIKKRGAHIRELARKARAMTDFREEIQDISNKNNGDVLLELL